MTKEQCKERFEKWCDKYQRHPLDIDDVDNKLLCITFPKNYVLYKRELGELLDLFPEVSVTAYSSYLDVRLYYIQ